MRLLLDPDVSPQNQKHPIAWKLHDDSNYRWAIVVAASIPEALERYQADLLAAWRLNRRYGQDEPSETVLKPSIDQIEQMDDVESIIFEIAHIELPEPPAKAVAKKRRPARKPQKNGKRRMSAAARQRISQGMKRSYAERRAANPPQVADPFRED